MKAPPQRSADIPVRDANSKRGLENPNGERTFLSAVRFKGGLENQPSGYRSRSAETDKALQNILKQLGV